MNLRQSLNDLLVGYNLSSLCSSLFFISTGDFVGFTQQQYTFYCCLQTLPRARVWCMIRIHHEAVSRCIIKLVSSRIISREEWEGNLKITSHPVDHTKKWVKLWLAAVSPCRAPIGRLSPLSCLFTSLSCWGTHFLYLSNPPSGNLLPIIPCFHSSILHVEW